MTMERIDERRRSPRVPVRTGHVYLRTTWSTVQLLDISLGGVLMSSTRPFEVGQRGQFRAVLGDERVAARVQVVREELPSQAGQQGPVKCAAAFVALDEASRRSLEKFLRYRPAE
jgi:hypothetical protein